MSNENQKDLIYYVSKFGKGVKNIFKSPSKNQTLPKVEKQKSITETDSENPHTGTTFADLMKIKPIGTSHQFSFGEVYANDLAKTEIEKDNPIFPVGSIIVREKKATETSDKPELVIAMVKQEKGFSEKTDDWEFFVFNGSDLQMQKRETKGNCADCHSNAKQFDWVFREYMKK